MEDLNILWFLITFLSLIISFSVITLVRRNLYLSRVEKKLKEVSELNNELLIFVLSRLLELSLEEQKYEDAARYKEKIDKLSSKK